MRLYTQPHQYDGGIDLHARSMYLCILDQNGAIVLHRNMAAAPEPFLRAIAPDRSAIAVAVEGLVTAGTGWPTSVPRKELPSYSDMPCT